MSVGCVVKLLGDMSARGYIKGCCGCIGQGGRVGTIFVFLFCLDRLKCLGFNTFFFDNAVQVLTLHAGLFGGLGDVSVVLLK